jgi:DNA-binding response OmpR family regulator
MKKILLIEDDHVVATVYRNKFKSEGFAVEVAEDGEIGYKLLRNFQPDVVLLDLMLPKLPGIDLIKKIRAVEELQTLPLIVFTNTYLSSTIQEAWKAGATKCLTKSTCTPKQVISTVWSVLRPDASTTPQAAAPSAAPIETRAVELSDVASHEEPQNSFADEYPSHIAKLRGLLQSLTKAENDADKLQQLDRMYRLVHTLTGNAGLVDMVQIAQLADALEALIKELFDKPRNLNASTLRTLASAVDCLAILFEQRAILPDESPAPRILVVDDEEISRRAVTHALEKAKLKSINAEDPLKAFDLITQLKYDLIFLDVDMPKMSGYELCTKIRTLPSYKKTPVVFVTSLNDFEARTNSTISGGNDFIAKPFLFIELTVKALIYVLRGQLQPFNK